MERFRSALKNMMRGLGSEWALARSVRDAEMRRVKSNDISFLLYLASFL